MAESADFPKIYAGAFVSAANALREAAAEGKDLADCGLWVLPHVARGTWHTRIYTRRDLVVDLLEHARALRIAHPSSVAKEIVELVGRIELTPGSVPIVLSTCEGHTLFLFNDSGLTGTTGALGDSFLRTLGGDAEKESA